MTMNPDPLEVWKATYKAWHDDASPTDAEADQAAAAIIAQHYAPLVAEVERLREALRRYGDRIRMATAPAELQQTIDDAMGEKS